MEAIGFVMYIVALLIYLVCTIVVAVPMSEDYNPAIVFITLFLFSPIIFIWGWVSWKAPEKLLVMIIWSIAFVLGLVAQVMRMLG